MAKDTFYNLPEEKRAQILDIALDEFADNDYRNASISRIVAKAGIAKGSFYQYFEDKKDCYLTLLGMAIGEKKTFLAQAFTPGQEMPLFNRLRWLTEAGLRFEFSSPRLARLGARAVFDDVPLHEDVLKAIRQGSHDYFRALVAEGMAAGTVRPDTDPEMAAFMLATVFTHLGQFLLERYSITPDDLREKGASSFDDEGLLRAVNDVISMLEQGLGARVEGKKR